MSGQNPGGVSSEVPGSCQFCGLTFQLLVVDPSPPLGPLSGGHSASKIIGPLFCILISASCCRPFLVVSIRAGQWSPGIAWWKGLVICC